VTRIPVVILAALLCCSLPAGVWAQGCLPGMPSVGCQPCDPWAAANCNCCVDGKLGWLGYNRGLVFGMDPTGLPVTLGSGPFPYCRQQVPVEGMWVGASLGRCCEPPCPCCLTLQASWLLPSNKQGSGGEQDPQYPTYNDPVGFLLRTWDPNIQWYTLEAYASRSGCCRCADFSLVGGFRYDSFSTKMSNFSLDPYGVGGPTDEGELCLSTYIPYVGAEACWGCVKVGAIGSPYVPGTIQFRETFSRIGERLEATGNYRNAYFLETFAEVRGQVQVGAVCPVCLSAFAMYSILHAVGDLNVSVSSAFPSVANSSQGYTWGTDRQTWIAGGKAVIGFNCPL